MQRQPVFPPKCDIILTEEEYELIMRHRAFKRIAYEQELRRLALSQRVMPRPAPKRPFRSLSSLQF